MSHRSLRYIYDRLRHSWHEWRHPDDPWIAPGAVDALRTLLRPDDVGIEWGAGRSTLWLARRIKHLISVEGVEHWYNVFGERLKAAGVTNVDYWLRPIVDESDTEGPYTHAADDVPDGSLDFALIDGAARGLCVLAAIPKLKPGGLLVVDNLHLYLDYPSRSPGTLYGKGPMNDNWVQFLARTKGWRSIIFTNGVSDTGIWIKQCGA